MAEIIAVKGMRKTIAARMEDSWHTSPRVAYMVSIDTTTMQKFRAEWNAQHEAEGVKLSFNHIFMKACATTLKEFPYVNSSFDGKNIILHETVNIGLAVALENGLIVPNMKSVEKASLTEVARQTSALVEKARTMKVSLDEISGGTFTITNLGSFGIEYFTPIINQPECAILGVTKTIDTPVVVNGEVVIRPIMKLSLVADHRVIDGSLAAQFMERLKIRLETCADLQK